MLPRDIDPEFDPSAPSTEGLIRAEVQPGEKLVWVGRPTTDHALAEYNPVTAAVTGMALVLLALASTLQAIKPGLLLSPGWQMAPVLIVPCTLFGLVVGLLPAWAYFRAGGTAYALTDRRAILLELRRRGSFVTRSYGPDRLGALARRDSPFGGPAGSLIFEDNSRDIFKPRPTVRRGFLHVEDAAAVEGLIRTTLLDPLQGRPDRPPDAVTIKPKPLGFARTDPDFDGPFNSGGRDAKGLGPGETLIWAGRPRPGLLLAPLLSDVLMSSPILGIGLLCCQPDSILRSRPIGRGEEAYHGLFFLLGASCIMFGLGIVAQAARSAWVTHWTRYVLTDRRALIQRKSRFARDGDVSFAPAALTGMVRRQRPDGAGDLIFAEATPGDPAGDRGFLAVDDVRAVEGLVRSTLLDGRRGG